MSWVETTSLSFSARHAQDDAASAERILDELEDLRLELEQRLPAVSEDVAVIVHSSPAQLALAHPYLLVAQRLAAPAARRYLAGWATRTELHVLADREVEARAAGPESRLALLGTPARLYAQHAVATGSGWLPPPWTPRRFTRYLRYAWLVEGAAQYFSSQVPLFRAAVGRRLREGPKPAFPPKAADAVVLGGTVFELLSELRGPSACEVLASRPRRGGPEAAVALAFEAPVAEVAREWRAHLERIRPGGADGARTT
ncbi:MAG: hypothetical protein ACR2NA_05400 [Solirubrobacterales bacterium]